MADLFIRMGDVYEGDGIRWYVKEFARNACIAVIESMAEPIHTRRVTPAILFAGYQLTEPNPRGTVVWRDSEEIPA